MPDSRMVHAVTASLLLGTSGWAIKELQHKFTMGLAWYILVSIHSVCLLFLFVTGAHPQLGKARDLSSWLAGALGLPLLAGNFHLRFTSENCAYGHCLTAAPPILAWLAGSIANRNRLTELVVLSSSLSIGILCFLHGNTFGMAAAVTMLALSGVINVNLAEQLSLNRDDMFRVGLAAFNHLILMAVQQYRW
ncbi:uncharacterized protein LOC122377375 [Amphibalanus amphitrite]|uniref:uncharacterized protein LOC122377375 n=1 Tax=Amphibalanus amphitrite TaxID=1232801 RepID=UPI001C91F055|nr:uncharacterized protein LOC122377375 [Amphibalanus amphitrite]